MEERKNQNNNRILIKILSVIILTFLIYTIHDWYFWALWTRDAARVCLSMLGIENSIPYWQVLYKTPVIFLDDIHSDFWISKDCTGMQAGALLLSLIVVSNSTVMNKLKTSIIFMILLFIGNSLRVAFHLWLTMIMVTVFGFSTPDAFFWAHDMLSKVIGFFGTIFFTFIIEKMGVPIIDQLTDWFDWIWWNVNRVGRKE